MYEVRFYNNKTNTFVKTVSTYKFMKRDKAIEFGEKNITKYERYAIIKL